MNAAEKMNQYRRENGYLTVEEIVDMVCPQNVVYDVYTLLISSNVKVGTGNIFYAGVLLHADKDSAIQLGNGNVLMTNTHLEAGNGGQILAGDDNLFGDGIVSVLCNTPGGRIVFGSHGRYDGRINIYGSCRFESGSQILGTIKVYDCTLKEGGSFAQPDPDLRAGVLKGMGTARNLTVERGLVINGFGDFGKAAIEPQTKYHKKPER